MSNIIKTDWLRVLCLGFLSFLFGIPPWCFILTWIAQTYIESNFRLRTKPHETHSKLGASPLSPSDWPKMSPLYHLRIPCGPRVYTQSLYLLRPIFARFSPHTPILRPIFTMHLLTLESALTRTTDTHTHIKHIHNHSLARWMHRV